MISTLDFVNVKLNFRVTRVFVETPYTEISPPGGWNDVICVTVSAQRV